MTSTRHTIEILRPDGSVDTEERTLWSTEHGPVIDFPGVGWTDANVLTYRDANIDNDEFVEQYLDMIDVEDLDDLIRTHRTHKGVPLFNTVATGSDGRLWYADTSAAPNLSAEAEQLFRERLASDLVTQVAWDNGVMLLDGSDSRFQWQRQRGARDPGLVPWTEMPMVKRADHLFNANDSYWVPHATFTLDGPYSIVHGEAGTPRSLRTRQNAVVLAPADPLELSGRDGLFTGPELRDAVFDNSSFSADRLRRWVVDACRETTSLELPELLAEDGSVELPAATVDLTGACDVLVGWDGRYDLDRVGPILWRETMTRFSEEERTTTGPLWGDRFDPERPSRTPGRPADDPTSVLTALARAVQVLELAGFAVDATLGSAQFTERSGERIAIHGGTSVEGVTNIVQWSDANSSSTEPQPQRGDPVVPGSDIRSSGYPVNSGTSFVMTVDYTDDEPAAWAILTYGQSDDRTAEHVDQQTVRFSEKNWRSVAFTEEQILADPGLRELVVRGN
jgi:acyl-homoserine-lactone acylase